MPEVDGYRVVLYGSSQDKPDLKAKVELYGQKHGEQRPSMGKLRFHTDGAELPPDTNKKGCPEMSLPASQLGLVIDLLRRERPIYYAFHEGRAVLGTGIEPVGRDDGASPEG